MKDDKQNLYEDQKKLLDTFLKTGAIDKAQYEKSLNGLKEKMGIEECNKQVILMHANDKEVEELLASLNKTKFRGSFHLNNK